MSTCLLARPIRILNLLDLRIAMASPLRSVRIRPSRPHPGSGRYRYVRDYQRRTLWNLGWFTGGSSSSSPSSSSSSNASSSTSAKKDDGTGGGGSSGRDGAVITPANTPTTTSPSTSTPFTSTSLPDSPNSSTSPTTTSPATSANSLNPASSPNTPNTPNPASSSSNPPHPASTPTSSYSDRETKEQISLETKEKLAIQALLDRDGGSLGFAFEDGAPEGGARKGVKREMFRVI